MYVPQDTPCGWAAKARDYSYVRSSSRVPTASDAEAAEIAAAAMMGKPAPEIPEWAPELNAARRSHDLLIRSSMCGHPVPFRSVRDLGRVPARCSCPFGIPEGRSPRWLPAWLPAARLVVTTNGFQEHR
jgi:hypothetical protein